MAEAPVPGGWIPAWRRIYDPDHWLAPSRRDPSNKRDAWLDLCQMATHQPRETRASGILMVGELVVSLRTLAKRWGWHRSRAERFVCELRMRTAIETVRETPDGTVYRIVNYDTYATVEKSGRDTNRDRIRDSGETAARQEQPLEPQNQEKKPPFVPPQNEPKKPTPKRTQLPEGWEPTTAHAKRAKADGLDLEREAEKFRAHHAAKGSLFLRWDQAFTTWLLNAKDFQARNGANKPPADSEAAQWDAEAERWKETKARTRAHLDRDVRRLTVTPPDLKAS